MIAYHGALSGIKSLSEFSTSKTLKNTNDPLERMKINFLNGVKEQLEILEADMKGETLKVSRIIHQKAEDGKTSKVERDKRLRRWWTLDKNRFTITVYYGNKQLFDEAIIVDQGPANVRMVLEKLIQAAENDELRDAFQFFADRSKESRSKKKQEPKEPEVPKEPAAEPQAPADKKAK